MVRIWSSGEREDLKAPATDGAAGPCAAASAGIWRLAGLAAVLAILAGCAAKGGLPTAPVSGKVTYKGKPVPNGTVMFVPEQGPAATGNLNPDGTYKLTTFNTDDGAVLGKHKVSITALAEMGNLLPEQRSGTPPPLVPTKYLSHETSGLTAEVKEGDNQIDFELKD